MQKSLSAVTYHCKQQVLNERVSDKVFNLADIRDRSGRNMPRQILSRA